MGFRDISHSPTASLPVLLSENESDRISLWFIACAATLYGSVTVGGKFLYGLGFSLYEISLYPLVLSCVILAPLMLRAKRVALTAGDISLFLLYGFIGAFLQLSQFGGIVLGVPVATVAFLLYTQPVWTIILGRVLLRESITTRKMIALVSTFCGMLLLVQGEKAAEGSPFGSLSAVLGGVLLAFWIVWGRKSGLQCHHYLVTTFCWSGSSAMWLLTLRAVPLMANYDGGWLHLSLIHSLRSWLFLAGFTIVAVILPSLLFFRGLKVVAASTAGILMLFEPVSASLMSAIIFRETLGIHALLGGFMIILSSVLLPRDR